MCVYSGWKKNPAVVVIRGVRSGEKNMVFTC